jgi:hypothetical protein
VLVSVSCSQTTSGCGRFRPSLDFIPSCARHSVHACVALPSSSPTVSISPRRFLAWSHKYGKPRKRAKRRTIHVFVAKGRFAPTLSMDSPRPVPLHPLLLTRQIILFLARHRLIRIIQSICVDRPMGQLVQGLSSVSRIKIPSFGCGPMRAHLAF